MTDIKKYSIYASLLIILMVSCYLTSCASKEDNYWGQVSKGVNEIVK